MTQNPNQLTIENSALVLVDPIFTVISDVFPDATPNRPHVVKCLVTL